MLCRYSSKFKKIFLFMQLKWPKQALSQPHHGIYSPFFTDRVTDKKVSNTDGCTPYSHINRMKTHLMKLYQVHLFN